MTKFIRTIFLTLLFSLVVCVPCFAQYLYSADKSACFVVNDNWRKISIKDNFTMEVITIGYGGYSNNTYISLKKNRYPSNFKELKYCDYATKVALTNDSINTSLRNLRNQGFTISVNGTPSISNNSVIIGYVCSKDGKTYRVSETYTIKDYYGYCLVTFSPEEGIVDMYDAVSNLFVNGKEWFDFIQ